MNIIDQTITSMLKLNDDAQVVFGLAMLFQCYSNQAAQVRAAAIRLGVGQALVAQAIAQAQSNAPAKSGCGCGGGSMGAHVAVTPGPCGGLGQPSNRNPPATEVPPTPGQCTTGVDCGPNSTEFPQPIYDEIQIVGAASVTYTIDLDRKGYFIGLELFARDGIDGWKAEDVVINQWEISTTSVPLYATAPTKIKAPNLVEIPAQLFVNAGAGVSEAGTSKPYRPVVEGNNWIPPVVFQQLLQQGSGFVKFVITNKSAATVNIPIAKHHRFIPDNR